MADRESTPRAVRKPSAMSDGAGQNGVGGATRITDAQCLTLAQTLVILDESTELPPFGMCMSGLQQRLKRRLGLEIAETAIKACLSPYYDLAEWEDRYITKSLGVEVEEFGSADHPPRSPLKEYFLSSDGEEGDGSDDDGYDGDAAAAAPAGSGTEVVLDDAVDLGRAGGGSDDGGGAGENMQGEAEEEEEEEEEDAATGAGATGGEEFGAGNVGGGRARSGGGAGGGAAAAPTPAKAADAAGSKASPHLARPTTQWNSHSAPSSSTGEVFQGTEKLHSLGTGSSQWGAGGGGAIEVVGMEVE